MDCYEIIPEEATSNMPLIVFLHGSGEIGNFDSLKDLPIIQYIESGNAYKSGKFIFIAPHSGSGGWGSSNVKQLANVINYVKNQYKIDENKIVLTGMSFGARQTWYLASENPNMFSAVVPISGDPFSPHGLEKPENFKTTAVLAIVSNGDSYDISIQNSMKNFVIEIGKAKGYQDLGNLCNSPFTDVNFCILDKYNGITMSHSTIMQYYNNDELYKWMLNQNKK